MRQLFQAQKLQLLYSVCFRQFVIAKHSQSFNLGVQYIISSQQAFVPLPLCGTPLRFGHLLLCFGQLDPSDTLWVGTSCQLVAIAVTPVAGWFTDRYGAAMTAFVGAIYATLVAFPGYLWLVLDPSLGTAYLAVGFFFGIAQGFTGANINLFCANLFPPRLWCQGMALSYNIGE